MKKRPVVLIVVLLVNVLVASVALAAWEPQGDEWPGFRRDTAHSGEMPTTSLFTDGPGGFAKVKWARTGANRLDHPVGYPPPVGDLNRDGIPEVLVSGTDVAVCIEPNQLDCSAETRATRFSFNHRVEVLDGRTGATRAGWPIDEDNSFALLNGANILGLVADNNIANIVYFRGNPLFGTSATNNLVARELSGSQKWQFVDPVWGNSKHPLGVLVGAQAANTAPDALNEVVTAVSLVDFNISTAPTPGCPQTQAFICIDAAGAQSYVYSLDGEGSSATIAWRVGDQVGTPPTSIGVLASTPAISDLDGNGTLDTVIGTGLAQGTLINTNEVDVRTDQSAVDNRVVAISGGGDSPAGSVLWTRSITDDITGVVRPMSATPVVAGTVPDAGHPLGASPVIVFLAPVTRQCSDADAGTRTCATTEPEPNNRNVLIAFNGRTGQELWRSSRINGATAAPLGAADLDGDGQPELIVQAADRLQVYRNDGSDFWGSSCAAPSSPDPDHVWPQTSCVRYARSLTSNAGVAVADLDSDGTKEIVAVLEGDLDETSPIGDCSPSCAELLVVNGTNGAIEWTFPFAADESVGGPVIADVDGDDDLLEIVVPVGNVTGTDPKRRGGVVVVEPNAPDLNPTLAHSGDRIVGNPQTVTVTVGNIGTRAATGAVVRLLDNGTPVGDHVVNVPAGGTAQAIFSWTPATAGSHQLTAVDDPNDLIRELRENNNTSQAVTVITGIPPVADFTFSPAAPTEIQTVQFTDTSTVDGTGTPPATIVSRQWSCSDGFASTAAGPSHKFADGGSYTCTLEVTDSRGFSDTSDAKTIDVSHVAPFANFNTSVTSPGNVQFTDASTHPNSPQDAPPTGWSYAWEFGDGGTSTVRNPSHDYGVETGFFAVHLTVTDNDGQTDDITKTIDVASTLITRTGPWDEEIVAVSERPDILGFGTADGEAGANLETGEITATATVTQTTLPTGVILDGLPPIGASIATGSGSLRALVNVAEAGPHRVTVTMQIDSAAALGGAVFPLGSASSSASATAAAALATCTGPVCMVLPATQVSAQQALACRPGTCTHGPTVTFTMILNVPAPGPVAIDGGLVTTASIRGAGEASAVASAHLLSVTIGPA